MCRKQCANPGRFDPGRISNVGKRRQEAIDTVGGDNPGDKAVQLQVEANLIGHRVPDAGQVRAPSTCEPHRGTLGTNAQGRALSQPAEVV